MTSPTNTTIPVSPIQTPAAVPAKIPLTLHQACALGGEESYARVKVLLQDAKAKGTLAELLHSREGGYTPLYVAAAGGHLPIVKLLTAFKTALLIEDQFGSAQTIASKRGHTQCVDRLKNVISKIEMYDSPEGLARRRVAHLFDIDDTEECIYTSFPTHDPCFSSLIAQTLSSRDKNDPLIEAFNHVTNAEKIYKTIKNEKNERPKPAVIKTGYDGHTIYLVIYGNYMAVINRGYAAGKESIESFIIDPKKVTPAIIASILQQISNKQDVAETYLYNTLPASLNAQRDEDAAFVFSQPHLALPKQTTGNCMYAAPEGALYYAMVIGARHKGSSREVFESDAFRQRLIFEGLRETIQDRALNDYRSSHRTEERDPHLIKQAKKVCSWEARTEHWAKLLPWAHGTTDETVRGLAKRHAEKPEGRGDCMLTSDYLKVRFPTMAWTPKKVRTAVQELNGKSITVISPDSPPASPPTPTASLAASLPQATAILVK